MSDWIDWKYVLVYGGVQAQTDDDASEIIRHNDRLCCEDLPLEGRSVLCPRGDSRQDAVFGRECAIAEALNQFWRRVPSVFFLIYRFLRSAPVVQSP